MPFQNKDSQTYGLVCMVIACFGFCAMGTCSMLAHHLEPNLSGYSVSFMRVLVNLLIILVIYCRDFRFRSLKKLWGDGSSSLWMRGLFGGLSLMLYFYCIPLIGLGEAAFINGSSSIFVAALSPLILKQASTLKSWIAVTGGFFGLYLLSQPRLDDGHPLGRILALISGFSAAIAYIMIAAGGKRNPSSVVIFYLCFISIFLHGFLFLFVPVEWPTHLGVWFILILVGGFAALSQFFLTEAYRYAPATSNASLYYLQPVLSMLVSMMFFGLKPDGQAWLGAGFILICGVALPFLKPRIIKNS